MQTWPTGLIFFNFLKIIDLLRSPCPSTIKVKIISDRLYAGKFGFMPFINNLEIFYCLSAINVKIISNRLGLGKFELMPSISASEDIYPCLSTMIVKITGDRLGAGKI